MLALHTTMDATATTLDEDLVRRSLAGDRSAFGKIVARYQSLVAAIAYAATGSLSRSEDLAQETFIEAWTQLKALREPASLRAWLCGIVRNRTHGALRRDQREPTQDAESIDVAAFVHTAEAAPLEQAISAEEQALLWRALDRIPETYREALVLFYREQQSIETVASALAISEDAAKQRLSRGRRLLHEQVRAFVEGVLARSAPAEAFTAGVIAALPVASPATVTALVAVKATTQGGTLAKATGLAAIATALIGPVVAFVGSYFSVRAQLDATRTPRERATVQAQTRRFAIASVIYTIATFAVLVLAPYALPFATWYAAFAQLLPLGFACWLALNIARAMRESRQLRADERLRCPELFDPRREQALRIRPEYRSRWTLLGLPLIHVRYDTPTTGTEPARGWVAIGDRADGVLFAMGGVARGGIAIGGIAIGGVAFGAVAIAPLALGCCTFGLLALGGAAYGWNAVGGFAAGWHGAAGALAVSRDYAAGGLALGAHANDAAVGAYFARALPDPLVPLLLALLIVLCVLPAALFAWRARANLRPPTS